MKVQNKAFEQDFDMSRIADMENVATIESIAPPPSVYKYYSAERSDFFRSPRIRFTQKEFLNDPFELTSRWEEFASPKTRLEIGNSMKSAMTTIFSDKALLIDYIRKDFLNKGIALNAEEMAHLSQFALTKRGREFVDKFLEEVVSRTDFVIDVMFGSMDETSNPMFAEVLADVGVFSVSEVLDSHQMWGLYANSGRGFVVEFDTKHKFFNAENAAGNALRKIKYSNENIKDFWENPLYLFFVKNKDWSFEREWRMLKPLSQCDHVVGQDVFLCDVPKGMIKSITFGYAYENDRIVQQVSDLESWNSGVVFKKAVVNQRSKEIVCLEL